MAKRYLIIAAAVFALAAGSALAADQTKGPFAGTVHAVGTVVPNGEGQIDVQTDVVITVVPAAPSTSMVDAAPTRTDQGTPAKLLILVLALATLVVTRVRAKAR